MKYRMKVEALKRNWQIGIVVYNTLEEAKKRQTELQNVGISAIIVDEFGGELK